MNDRRPGPGMTETGKPDVREAGPGDDAFLRAFEDGSLPPAAWTHEAHVRLAWLVLRREALSEATDRVRDGIRRYNATVLGRPEAYHDTLTVAYVRIIASRMRPHEDWAGFAERNPDLLDYRRPVTSRYYSAARMASPEARERVLAPDLEPLP